MTEWLRYPQLVRRGQCYSDTRHASRPANTAGSCRHQNDGHTVRPQSEPPGLFSCQERASRNWTMCGRYVSPDEASIEREFTLVRTEWQFPPSYKCGTHPESACD
jgi:hypothetical protein